MVSTKKEYALVIFLLFTIFLVYSSSLRAPFIFDDNHMIVKNAFIKNSKYFGSFLKGFVSGSPIAKGMCRPLLMFTFAFNYLTGKLNPIGYHIINVLFHFLNAVLLYFLLKNIFREKNVSFLLLAFITTLFVVHPVNTEAVTYISSRSDLLVTFFILIGFIGYLNGRLVLSSLMYLFALGAKEIALCFPIFIFSHYFLYGLNHNDKKSKTKIHYFFIISIIITLVYIVWYKKFFYGGLAPENFKLSLTNIPLQSWVSFFYLKLFLWPSPLNIDNAVPAVCSLFETRLFLPFLGIVFLLVLFFIFRKKYYFISLGLLWYLVYLLPKFYAKLGTFPACEHQLYLPSIGLYVLLTFILYKAHLNQGRYFLYVSIAIILLFGMLTWIRNYEYSDSLLFWKTAVRRNVKSAASHNNLGFEYVSRNFFSLAEKEFRAAILYSNRIEDTISAKINLSHIYIENKQYDKALTIMKDLEKIKKVLIPGFYQNLGIIYMAMGKEREAIRAWEKEIINNPVEEETYLNLGVAYLKKDDFKNAKIYFQKAIEINPANSVSGFGLEQIRKKTNNLM